MTNKRVYIGLDVGTRRIGAAIADSIGRIAQPVATIMTDGQGLNRIAQLIKDYDVTDIVVGLPRDQSGLETGQTQSVRRFAATLTALGVPLHWQDESVTSILAEERLKHRKKTYSKADIDAEAAAIILQDFMESQP